MAGEGDRMMRLRRELTEILARFDDDAFAALANRGLLRRAYKDLESQAPTLVEESAEILMIGLGANQIRFDVRGPAHATCTCPAGNICQHILAAAIALQRLGPTSDIHAGTSHDPLTSGDRAVEAEPADLSSKLLAMSKNELSAYCGKAGYRWAWQYVLDLDLEEDLSLGGEEQIVIGFRHPRVNLRYLGGGIDNLIADIRLANLEKYAVAAVLAYQRAHGVTLTAPDPGRKAQALSLNLGQEGVVPESTAAAQLDFRQRLRVKLRQILSETLEIGLSHLSRSMFERFTTLAVSAQGAEYHRLDRLLRRVANHIEMLLERAGNADEHLLFDELTLAYGLVSALDAAARKGSVPTNLAGKARNCYDNAGDLHLFGLGASPWRAPSGYLGLTLLFWSPAERSFLTYTDARPATQSRSFDPFTRYSEPGPWSGLASPAAATGSKIHLAKARISEGGRLSASAGSTVIMDSTFSAEEIIAQIQPCTNWSEVIHRQQSARRSLLARLEPQKDWVALQPRAFGPPRFDGNRQTLLWPLFDAQGERIDANLPFSDYNRQAILRIEEAGSLAPETVLIGSLRHNRSGLVLVPLSLIHPDVKGGVVESLHFAHKGKKGEESALLPDQRQGCDLPEVQEPPLTLLPLALQEIGSWLRRTAERGVQGESSDGCKNELRVQCEKAGKAGFIAFSRLSGNPESVQEILLQANYLRLQYEQLINERAIVPCSGCPGSHNG